MIFSQACRRLRRRAASFAGALALFVLGASSALADQTFNNPQVNGIIVDNCATWGADCGQGGADQFCRTQGYQGASSFQITDPGRTYVIGSRQVCEGAPCGGFSQVVCTGGTGGGFTFNAPQVGGAPVDHCATWATNCGQGGADQFCRTQGYSRAIGFTTYTPGRTFVIGSQQTCEGGTCVGLAQVVCVSEQPTQTGGTFDYPQVNGVAIDNCAGWGTDCGQGGADQFCRLQGYGGAVSFQLFNPGRTWVVGAQRACEGGGCVGFSQVVCGAARVGELRWSYAGPIEGMACTQFLETSDPNTWNDNYLCVGGQDLGLQWSSAGPIGGMKCTQLLETSDPHTWNDNYVCVPPGAPIELRWSSAGPIGGLTCVQINEPSDPHTWDDNYLCY